MSLDVNKFSFAQLTSNKDGKTSGSGTAGFIICLVGILCFLLGAIDRIWLTKSTDVMTDSTLVITIGAGLLGYRKSKDNQDSLVTNLEESNKDG